MVHTGPPSTGDICESAGEELAELKHFNGDWSSWTDHMRRKLLPELIEGGVSQRVAEEASSEYLAAMRTVAETYAEFTAALRRMQGEQALLIQRINVNRTGWARWTDVCP